MGLSPVTPVSTDPPGATRRATAMLRSLGRSVDPHDPAVVRQTASQLVSEMVFVPLLAQMREFPFGTELGQGGRGEAVFGEQLDRQVADATAASERNGLVDQLARRLQKSPEAPAAPCPSWPVQEQLRRSTEGVLA